MLWTLLIGPADILIPVKLAIPIGYFGLLHVACCDWYARSELGQPLVFSLEFDSGFF